MKNKLEVVKRRTISKGQAIDQFERFRATKDASDLNAKENQKGYSTAYAEGWTRIFGKKDEEIENKATQNIAFTGEEDTETET